MATSKEYFANWFRWRRGRQESGYEKMLILANPFLLPFDIYLLRFRKGSEVPPHIDPVSEKKHYRLNLVLKQAREGGHFSCANPIYESRRIKIFRPDLKEHSVSRINEGTRYVLSIGWVLG